MGTHCLQNSGRRPPLCCFIFTITCEVDSSILIFLKRIHSQNAAWLVHARAVSSRHLPNSFPARKPWLTKSGINRGDSIDAWATSEIPLLPSQKRTTFEYFLILIPYYYSSSRNIENKRLLFINRSKGQKEQTPLKLIQREPVLHMSKLISLEKFHLPSMHTVQTCLLYEVIPGAHGCLWYDSVVHVCASGTELSRLFITVQDRAQLHSPGEKKLLLSNDAPSAWTRHITLRSAQ